MVIFYNFSVISISFKYKHKQLIKNNSKDSNYNNIVIASLNILFLLYRLFEHFFRILIICV